MTDTITTLRTAAGAMARDGQAGDADWLTREADIAEAFDGHGYWLGAPERDAVEAACAYLGEVA